MSPPSRLATTDAPLLEVVGLTKHFPASRTLLGRTTSVVHALDGVSFELGRGETLAVVGESGCGKTTLGRTVIRLHEPTAGELTFDGIDLCALSQRQMRGLRRRMQIVFQDPMGSLNPRMTVEEIVSEPLITHRLAGGRAARREHVAALLDKVGLRPDALDRRPHEFSGGQRQRIGIARALAPGPELVVADEPISALDVSVQAQIVNLLEDLQASEKLSYLFISHDLRIVRHLAHRVAVMYLGEIVELAPAAALYTAPAHPYTRALLSAIPVPDPERRRMRIVLDGDPPSPMAPPPGCRFHPRCPLFARLRDERCRREAPALASFSGAAPGHVAACHFAGAEPIPVTESRD